MLAMVLIWVATAVANNKLDSRVDAAIDESKSYFSVTVQYSAFPWGALPKDVPGRTSFCPRGPVEQQQ